MIPRSDLSAGVEDKGLRSVFVGIDMSTEINSNSYAPTLIHRLKSRPFEYIVQLRGHSSR